MKKKRRKKVKIIYKYNTNLDQTGSGMKRCCVTQLKCVVQSDLPAGVLLLHITH